VIKRDVTYSELNKHCWTEDNRIQAMSDKNNGAWYNYDATGERNLKLTGQTMHVNQNGQDYYTPIFDQQTLYANPLITINDKGYTKHYFEEGKRICSKIGSGGLIDIGGNMEGIRQGIEEIRDIQREGVERTFDMCMQLYPYIKTNNLHKTVVQPYENPINPDEPIFYYHSDHLGSASYITDSNGYEIQQLVYLPFGEDWVDMKYNTQQYDTPYKFNGKEKDEELRSNREYNNINNKYHEQTGYNNYGARYYYDWASIWLSVDPMSDKYPHLTSYNYCANNPVMLIDPDGMEIDDYFSYEGKYLGSDNAETDNVRIVDENMWNMASIPQLSDENGGFIDHDLGVEISDLHSEAGLTDEASLKVYDHYNTGALGLENYKGTDDFVMKWSHENGKSKIIVNNEQMKYYGFLDHSNEIINSLVHEYGHEDDFRSLGIKRYKELGKPAQERSAIEKQMLHPTFDKTRSYFRILVFDYLKQNSN